MQVARDVTVSAVERKNERHLMVCVQNPLVHIDGHHLQLVPARKFHRRACQRPFR